MSTEKDPSVLIKCENFLLHPTVRTLSLAQRVDFLEKKGFSPKEITQCLKSIEQRNGLSQLTPCPATELPTNVDIYKSKPLQLLVNSPLQVLQVAVKKYGLGMLLVVLLGYGYIHYRQKKMEQLLFQHEAVKTQRKKRLHLRVKALLDVLKQQQMQYKQAAGLLEARVTKCGVKEEAAANEATLLKKNLMKTQSVRGVELQALQSELLELKSAVVDTYLHPPSAKKDMEGKKKLSMLLQPTLFHKDGWVVQTNADTTQHVESSKTVSNLHTAVKKVRQTVAEPHIRRRDKKRSSMKDQTTMSSEEIMALFERGQVEEELSTAGSYRLLFAT